MAENATRSSSPGHRPLQARTTAGQVVSPPARELKKRKLISSAASLGAPLPY
ncbi:hypothetical protein [Geotalea toluenoxydans]|uniref:hypothetical protein n=1 Tax=Geotalea toluenoxydans TaxID=421624 RepID=UPI001FB45A54|nr:hypothetical protein [Geotalea toluenoxydans]